jgi:hypothetical protein
MSLLWTKVDTGVSDQALKAAYKVMVELVPDEPDTPEEAVEGWIYCVTGICSAFDCFFQTEFVDQALDAAENAYLAIREGLANQYMKEHSTYLDNGKEPELESSSPKLSKETAYQLECLQGCESGEKFDRPVRGSE